MMDASQIGKRAWSYAGVLQDAGLSCFEYVEQLTLLLFLKMADQLTEAPYNKPSAVSASLGWKTLLKLDGAPLEDKYREILEKLGHERGMLGVIFKSARCEIHNPALLKQLIVNLLDKVDWLSLPVDVKGTIYEELLQRSAAESSRGAGQYFTPRPAVSKVTIRDLRHACSSGDSWYMKWGGKRSVLRFTAWFKALISTWYRAARSESRITLCPRRTRITRSMPSIEVPL